MCIRDRHIAVRVSLNLKPEIGKRFHKVYGLKFKRAKQIQSVRRYLKERIQNIFFYEIQNTVTKIKLMDLLFSYNDCDFTTHFYSRPTKIIITSINDDYSGGSWTCLLYTSRCV